MYNDLDHRTTVGGIRGAGDTRSLFSQTMGYVAATVGIFALGTYLGRTLSYGWGWVFFLAAFACLIGLRFAVRGSGSTAVGLLFGFGLLMGLATAPTVVYYAGWSPGALASGWGHGPFRDRTWDDGLCDPTRPVRDRPSLFLGALGTDYLRHRRNLHADTERLDHLLRCGTGDIRRSYHVRLPEATRCKRH